MSMARWWGAPQTLEDTALTPDLGQCFEETRMFENAQPMTVRVRGVMVLEDYEYLPKDRNDLVGLD